MFHRKRTKYLISAIGHAALLLVGHVYDNYSDTVKYTDVDYHVFTDAAGYIARGGSPYDRHTYRYPPLLAWVALPNVYIHFMSAKIIFCCLNLICGALIEDILQFLYGGRCSDQTLYTPSTKSVTKNRTARYRRSTSGRRLKIDTMDGHVAGSAKGPRSVPWRTFKDDSSFELDVWINKLSATWLFNPLVAVIATRGNADAIPSFLVLWFLLSALKAHVKTAAAVFALAVHVRIYPIIYITPTCLYWLMTEGSYSINRMAREFLHLSTYWQLLKSLCRSPKLRWFASIFLVVFLTLNALCYLMYGMPYYSESIQYHFQRHDHRHNLSAVYYIMYLILDGGEDGYSGTAVKVASTFIRLFSIAQLALSQVVGILFAEINLPVSLFLQTVIFVACNKVITVQYFVWWSVLLPFPLAAAFSLDHSRRRLMENFQSCFLVAVCWSVAMASWMLFAYKLEFTGEPTYGRISIAGWMFFGCSIGIAIWGIRSMRNSADDKNFVDGCVVNDTVVTSAAPCQKSKG